MLQDSLPSLSQYHLISNEQIFILREIDSRIHSTQSLKHTSPEVIFIDRVDRSYISCYSYSSPCRVRLEYIFWWCEEGYRENWKSSRGKKSNQQSKD